MTQDDLSPAAGLSEAIGWPHRAEDWQFGFSQGQGVVAETDGAVTGTALCWALDGKVASLGMVIVASALQGQGIGRRLMEAVLARTGTRAVMLNGTTAGLPLYRSLGFAPVGTIHQHQGIASSVPPAPLVPGERIRPASDNDHSAILALDCQAGGIDRRTLMSALLAESECVLLDRCGDITGFALFRRFGRGYAVGPVVARDQGGAQALISHWVGLGAGKFVRLDLTGDSDLIPWVEGLGLAAAGTVTTMARGTPPTRGTEVRLFAIAAQAYG